MGEDYYAILQVARGAAHEVVEAAYRRLAWKYHPDVNKNPDASERMKALNEAYEVLGDPVKRAEYDRLLFGKDTATAEQPYTEARGETITPPFACEVCGRIDESLRATVFQFVVSLVVVSFKRGGGAGILCSSCRTKKAITYTLTSLLLGPWGLPWGLPWTLEAVGVNLSGGRQPREVNAPILKILGVYFLAVGKLDQAMAALEASLSFQEDADLREVLQRIQAESAAQRKGQTEHEEKPSPTSSGTPRPATVTREKPSTRAGTSNGLVVAGGLALWVIVAVVMYAYQGHEEPQVSAFPQLNAPPTPTEHPWPTAAATTYSIVRNEPPTPTREVTYATPTPYFLDYITPISGRRFYICVEAANVRAGPGTDYPVVQKLTSDWYVTAYGKIGEWYFIGYNGQSVAQFMHQSVLCDQPSALSRPTTPPTGNEGSVTVIQLAPREFQVCVPYGQVYDGPSTDSPLKGSIPKDGWWTIYAKYGDWYEGHGAGADASDESRVGFVLRSDFCDPDPGLALPCDDFVYQRWRNGNSDRYAPPCPKP